jgi:hypothetical protein
MLWDRSRCYGDPHHLDCPATSDWSIVHERLYANANPVAKLLWKLVPGRIDAGEKRWEDVSAS